MLKQKILNGEKIIGTHINFSDPSVGRIAGLAGFDYIWIDTEHNYISFESLLSQIIAVRSTGTDVIVRVPQDDLTATKKVLEMGPDGIVFPMVRSAEEADRLISYTLYPPYGRRGFGPMNAVGYGAFDTLDFVANNHKSMCRFIQIEHIDAVKNLDEIMKNEYIDGYIIGVISTFDIVENPFSTQQNRYNAQKFCIIAYNSLQTNATQYRKSHQRTCTYIFAQHYGKIFFFTSGR